MDQGVVRVGFVGCGRIADVHWLGYRNNPRAKLVALCDTSEATLARRGKEWGVTKLYQDFAQLLADPEVDAIEILTPQKLHESMTLQALAAGKHVALQKPMTTDLASADRMLKAAAESGLVFKVTENYVFYPPLVLARKLIKEGAIGDPISMHIQYVSGTEGGWEVPAEAWTWRVQEAREGRGFATFDHGHHLWSTGWFLLGDPERVFGWIESSDGLVDCPAQFQWKVAGAKRFGSCGFAHGDGLRVPSKYYSNDEWVEVHGSKGILAVARATGDVHTGPAVVLFDGTEWKAFDVDSDWGSGFVGATNDFISAILDKTPPMLTGQEARGILRFSLALQRSARLRREVFVDEMDRNWPALYAWRRRRRERKEASGEAGWLGRLFQGNTRSLAPRALELTRTLVASYKAPQPPLPDTSIGLILRGDGMAEQQLGLVVNDNKATLLEGTLPQDPRLVVTMAPGTWAAILLKKKRIEMAVLQGKIQFTGKVDEALKLKAGFDF